MTIKERYQQFDQWQKNPAKYQRSTESHHCINCGEDFQGNYCPTCGQSKDTGPVSWNNLRQEWMSLWGLGSRSLPITIVQLLLRPGYLMGEYICGKKRNSYSPLSLLILVALVVSLLGHWLNLYYTAEPTKIEIANSSLFGQILFWAKEHMDYAMLFAFLLLLVPTYIVFHYAPRCPHHTLPQGFFIQMFNATQYLCLMLIFGLLFKILGIGEADDVYDVSLFFKFFLPFVIFINYKQLFGYSVWGTLWRVIVCTVVWYLFFLLSFTLIILVYAIFFHGELTISNTQWNTESLFTAATSFFGFIILILCITYFINKWSAKSTECT